MKKAEHKRVMNKKRTSNARVIGGTDICIECKEPFVLKGRKSTKCETCRKIKRLELYRDYNASAVRKDRLRLRRKTDPKYALDRRMGTSIRLSMAAGSKQNKPWEAFVSFTLSDLIRHLERQFLDGMSWDNMSEWHIDHIVPLASFTYTSHEDDEFRAAWALTNLRPLWARENVSKSDQRLFLI